ncbi:MAG TPA: zinc ribbon domain-containing protein [Myxococcota bacterium]|nr:zinc ribbon domain-containing protein [Myxococcota bacterium]HRY94380.1 zinc ribbon domain-containing protein [Myxococcota bacterium]HSA20006.1 zinc ribbon domain-containing protein [Myxococcota bacterium]
MAEDDTIQFTRNYHDQCTDKGFQFEFCCDRCGTGHRTAFEAFGAAQVAGVLEAASSLFGGLFGQAADVGERVRSAKWQQARDAAFKRAVEKLRPEFVQCPRCSGWVCKQKCWNTKKGLCKQCAPDLAVEMAAAQSARTQEEIWAHSKVAEEDREMLKEESWREGVTASCPSCGAALAKKTKFCLECGAKIAEAKHCGECGARLEPGKKFCGECGAKAG